MEAIVEAAVPATLAAAVVGMWGYLARFVREQRRVNEANRLANRSLQRAEIYRMFAAHVERGEPMAPHEMDHLADVYAAYHANGGNGTATEMYERILEHGKITTGG